MSDISKLNINSTEYDVKDASAISGLSVSGKVVTYTKRDGTTGTITTQDTNTTYDLSTESADGLMSSTDKTKLNHIYWIEGTGTTAGTWLATDSNISSYFDGLTIMYKIPIAGASNTYLNINDLGNKRCYLNNSTKLTTHFPVGQWIRLIYNASVNSGSFIVSDYDVNTNTNTAVRIYKDEASTYPIIGSRTAASSITSGSTTVYGEISETNAITMTPSSGTVTATNFVGSLTGNADTATTLGAETKGSETQPIYLDSGAPVACTYSLNTTVPSDAVFTDTVTTASTSGSGNAVTEITAENGSLTVTKGATFLTSHQDISGKQDASTAVTHTASTAAGSTTQPIYVDLNGVATACAYSLNKTVPSDAVFTDTNTVTTATTTGSGNAVTAITASNGALTVTKGTTFLTSHQDISGKQDKTTAVTHTASTPAGSATQPVYVNSSGVATACTYSLNKTVPSNAVFTDTNTVTTATTTGSGNAVTAITASNGALTVTKGTTFLTSHQSLAGYLPLSGGTMTGWLKFNSGYGISSSTLYATSTTTLHLCGSSYLNLRSPGIQCRNYDDTAWVGIAATGITNPSSRKYKENIADMTEEDAKKLLDVRAVSYDYVENMCENPHGQYDQRGVIAEEVEDVIPQVVSYKHNDDGTYTADGVDYTKFIPYLIKMVQIQQDKMDKLEEEVNSLKEEISNLKAN